MFAMYSIHPKVYEIIYSVAKTKKKKTIHYMWQNQVTICLNATNEYYIWLFQL